MDEADDSGNTVINYEGNTLRVRGPAALQVRFDGGAPTIIQQSATPRKEKPRVHSKKRAPVVTVARHRGSSVPPSRPSFPPPAPSLPHNDPYYDHNLHRAMSMVSLNQPVADYGRLQPTWTDYNGDQYHFRGLAAVMQRAGSRESVYLPFTDENLRVAHGVPQAPVPGMQMHTIQEWAPQTPQVSKEDIKEWKRIEMVFRRYDGCFLFIRDGLKDSGCDVGNLMSLRFLRALGLTHMVDQSLRGKSVTTGAGTVALLGTVSLPWMESPNGVQKRHDPTAFHIWDGADQIQDVIMGDEWCMKNNALSASSSTTNPGQLHVIRWAKPETPEELRQNRLNDEWQQREAQIAEAEAAERAMERRRRRLAVDRSASQPSVMFAGAPHPRAAPSLRPSSTEGPQPPQLTRATSEDMPRNRAVGSPARPATTEQHNQRLRERFSIARLTSESPYDMPSPAREGEIPMTNRPASYYGPDDRMDQHAASRDMSRGREGSDPNASSRDGTTTIRDEQWGGRHEAGSTSNRNANTERPEHRSSRTGEGSRVSEPTPTTIIKRESPALVRIKRELNMAEREMEQRQEHARLEEEKIQAITAQVAKEIHQQMREAQADQAAVERYARRARQELTEGQKAR